MDSDGSIGCGVDDCGEELRNAPAAGSNAPASGAPQAPDGLASAGESRARLQVSHMGCARGHGLVHSAQTTDSCGVLTS